MDRLLGGHHGEPPRTAVARSRARHARAPGLRRIPHAGPHRARRRSRAAASGDARLRALVRRRRHAPAPRRGAEPPRLLLQGDPRRADRAERRFVRHGGLHGRDGDRRGHRDGLPLGRLPGLRAAFWTARVLVHADPVAPRQDARHVRAVLPRAAHAAPRRARRGRDGGAPRGGGDRAHAPSRGGSGDEAARGGALHRAADPEDVPARARSQDRELRHRGRLLLVGTRRRRLLRLREDPTGSVGSIPRTAPRSNTRSSVSSGPGSPSTAPTA